MLTRNIFFALAANLLFGLSFSLSAADLVVDQGKEIAQLQVLAEQGDANAQFQLGTLYEFGEGVPLDNQIALGWHLRAAEQGHVAAQSSLGALYAFDLEDLPADYALARTWFLRAAEYNDARAQYNLGVIYRDSLGVERDTPAALAWFKKAAAQGDPQAQYNLGVMYESPGIEQLDQAVRWYRLSAAQGFAAAQYNLGVIYFNGNGVDSDPVLGYALLMLADANAPVASGGGQAPHEEAAQSMQKQQVDAGRVLASQLQEELGTALDRYLALQKTTI